MAELLSNTELLLQDKSKVEAGEFLKGKIVALYFSASWCPPCRHFTPILKEFYGGLKANNEPFEIVFISYDGEESAFWEYYEEHHGNWAIIPFGSPKIDELGDRYKVKGIPTLIVIKSDGTIISEDARSEVEEDGANREALINEWKKHL